MKIANLALLGFVLALVACSKGSQFPEPTGKGTFRAINAISTAPAINFRLEEVTGQRILPMLYRDMTSSSRFDDFEYNFNFEVRFAGELRDTRVATRTQKIEANKDYTFIATGAVESPTILMWVGDERSFEAEEAVAEVRLAHLAESVGAADFYFAPAGVAPVLGEADGTLAFGEVLPAQDVEAGNYVLTVTAAGDPATILFQSVVVTYAVQTAAIVAIFDGTADDTAPVSGRGLVTIGGSSFTINDARYPSTLSFVQASQPLETVDIYADEALTNQVIAALPYAGTSAEIDVADGEQNYFFTPAGTTGAVVFETTVIPGRSRRFEHYSIGETGEFLGISGARDTQPVEIYPTLAVTNMLFNEQIVDVYVVAAGESIADIVPRFSALYGFISGRLPLQAGVYDIIVTANGSKTPLAGTQVDLANGDVARFTLFATADPNVIEILPQP